MNTIIKSLFFGATTLTLIGCASAPTERSVAATSGCASLPNAKAEAAALYQPGVMYSAKPFEKKVFIARAIQPKRTFGAVVYVHAQKGMTQGYVERVLSCHAASGAAAHPNDPLHPTQGKLAEVSVRAAGDSLAVRIVGDSPVAGREIWQRAAAITSSGGGTVEVEQMARAASGPSAL